MGMNATKDEILGVIKITQATTRENVERSFFDAIKGAAHIYKGEDGEFALNSFADSFRKLITDTSE